MTAWNPGLMSGPISRPPDRREVTSSSQLGITCAQLQVWIVYSAVAVLLNQLLQYCLISCCSIVWSAVAVLFDQLLQYCLISCCSIAWSAIAVLIDQLLQYCLISCCSTVLFAVAVLLDKLLQYCLISCCSIAWSAVVVLLDQLLLEQQFDWITCTPSQAGFRPHWCQLIWVVRIHLSCLIRNQM